MALFTAILEFDGGTYVSQLRSASAQDAASKYASRLVKNKTVPGPAETMQSLAIALSQDSPVSIVGVRNVWCCSASVGKTLLSSTSSKPSTKAPPYKSSGFVSGHDFSRAEQESIGSGFSRCKIDSLQGLKPVDGTSLAARLKTCPDTNQFARVFRNPLWQCGSNPSVTTALSSIARAASCKSPQRSLPCQRPSPACPAARAQSSGSAARIRCRGDRSA